MLNLTGGTRRLIAVVGWALSLTAIAETPRGLHPVEAAELKPKPQNSLQTETLTVQQFDDCSAAFADSLRRWPVVDRTEVPILLASPRWKNETKLAVGDGPAFAGRLAEAINLRCGAKVRIAGPGAAGCHYATELALLPASDSQGQPVVVLALRVIRPGLDGPVLEEVFTVRKLTAAAPAFRLFGPPASRPAAKPGGKAGSGQGTPTYHAVTFGQGTVHLEHELSQQRVGILGERSWRDGAGQLWVEVRLLSRSTDASLEILAYYTDAAGRQGPIAKSTRQKLAAFSPASVVVNLPKEATSYALYIAGR